MIYRFGDCELDAAGFELRREGERVSLQPKVLEFLLLLVRRSGELVSKAELLDSLWPGVSVGESSLTRIVSLARRAVGDRKGPSSMLETVAGRGYRLRAQVSEAPSDSDVEHRLAAILSADVVDYSRLMAADEDATVESLKACRARVAEIVAGHRGRVVDFRGDDFLAEFPSAVDATSGALDIQDAMAERNEKIPGERQMRFRIGLHLGDVRAEGGQIFGDGINIASRLAALAEPGSVCISETVYHQVRTKLDVRYVDLGKRSLKNIPEPVHVLRIGGSDGALAESLPVDKQLVDRQLADTPVRRSAIAVLPFDDLSEGSDQEYFAAGLSEDLIVRLSEFRWFPVVARNSSFVYKGRAVDAKEVGSALAARYLVEGSVRRAGDVVRISAQLIDTSTGHHVWAERYDRELRDVFAVQDEITAAIAAALEPELWEAESQISIRRPPQNLGAWDCIQRGWWHLMRAAPEDAESVRELCARALALDSLLARSLYQVAASPGGQVVLRFTNDAPEAKPSDVEVETGPLTQATAHALAGRREQMIESLERAVQRDPAGVLSYRWLGLLLGGAAPRQGLAPDAAGSKDPLAGVFAHAAALAWYAVEDYAQSLEWAEACEAAPNWVLGFALRVASEAGLGNVEAARALLDDAAHSRAELTFGGLRPLLDGADPTFVRRLDAGIERAGWSE